MSVENSAFGTISGKRLANMKFSAKTTDLGNVESLTRIVAMVSKLAKQCVLRIGPDRLGFVRSGTRSETNKFYCEITAASFFEDFRMEGWSVAENEILLEIMVDELLQALRSAAQSTLLKVKLTRKNDAPYLTVDVKLSAPSAASRSVMHDVPITIIPPRLWSEYADPPLPDFDVSAYLPNVKTVHKVVNAIKSMSNHVTISANKKGGDMTFQMRTDPTELTTYFKDLAYVDWTDESSQGTQRSQLSGRRAAERPHANDNRSGDGDNEEDKLYSARVDIKTLAQFLASQQSAHYRLIINIVDNRMLHFCTVSEELRFQYFIPSMDE